MAMFANSGICAGIGSDCGRPTVATRVTCSKEYSNGFRAFVSYTPELKMPPGPPVLLAANSSEVLPFPDQGLPTSLVGNHRRFNIGMLSPSLANGHYSPSHSNTGQWAGGRDQSNQLTCSQSRGHYSLLPTAAHTQSAL
jgi:hypothetical protein